MNILKIRQKINSSLGHTRLSIAREDRFLKPSLIFRGSPTQFYHVHPLKKKKKTKWFQLPRP